MGQLLFHQVKAFNAKIQQYSIARGLKLARPIELIAETSRRKPERFTVEVARGSPVQGEVGNSRFLFPTGKNWGFNLYRHNNQRYLTPHTVPIL